MNNLLTFIFTLILIGSSFRSLSQSAKPETPVTPGSIVLNLGAGPGGHYYDDYYSEANVGIKAAIEFALWKAGIGTVTLGAETGASVDGLSHVFILAGRSAWHCGWHVRGLDTYAGVSLGFGSYSDDSKVYYADGSHPDRSFVAVGGFLGASYFLSSHFGFNMEVGYDISIVQAGVIFKLR